MQEGFPLLTVTGASIHLFPEKSSQTFLADSDPKKIVPIASVALFSLIKLEQGVC